MSSWAARARLHLSNKGLNAGAISDETPLMALMAPPFGALCEKRDSANDAQLIPHEGGQVSTPAAPDPDRHCWPHSNAMNGGEIDTFTTRLIRFTDKGLALDDGEALADQLVRRDRELDDRRLCLECTQLAGHAETWRCRGWQRAGIARQARDAGLPGELVRTLQRCDGFTATH